MANLIISLLMCMSMLTGCRSVDIPPEEPPETIAKAEYRKISVEEAYKMIVELKDYIILDVRTDEEYRENRIEGAVLIPDYEIKDRAMQKLSDKNQVILIYCRSGRRSANSAMELIDMGYMNVYDFGGIVDWNYDTVSG